MSGRPSWEAEPPQLVQLPGFLVTGYILAAVILCCSGVLQTTGEWLPKCSPRSQKCPQRNSFQAASFARSRLVVQLLMSRTGLPSVPLPLFLARLWESGIFRTQARARKRQSHPLPVRDICRRHRSAEPRIVPACHSLRRERASLPKSRLLPAITYLKGGQRPYCTSVNYLPPQ